MRMFSIIVLFSLLGCSKVETLEERDSRIKLKQIQMENRFIENVSVVKYNNHTYIFYCDGYGDDRNSGITHNPDCECLR